MELKTTLDNPSDGRLNRGEMTRRSLMRAAEKLIAERGIENVAIKDILSAAGQNNASALHYHFKSFPGLVAAIRAERGQAIKSKRADLTDALLAIDPAPDLRAVCKLMVMPAFELARSDPGFRHAIRAFGHEIALAEGEASEAPLTVDSAGARRIGALLRDQLTALDNELFQLRLDGALRYLAACLVHRAAQKTGFLGPSADKFVNNLADTLAGLLSAPVSEATQACQHELSGAQRQTEETIGLAIGPAKLEG
ncbi:MAG: helix-turn-helix domain-containing protein [Pseudomonadota bacterium]